MQDKKLILFFLGYLLFISPLKAQDSLQLMSYNLLNYPDVNPSRLPHLKTVLMYSQPDILIVNELNTEAGANNILVQCLNQDGINYYSRAPYMDGFGSDNMLFYDSRKIGLINQSLISTTLRPLSHYHLYLKDWDLEQTGDTAYLDVFSVHFKASTGSQNEHTRYEAAKALRDYIDNNTNGSNIIVGGDFNVYKSTESCMKVLMDSGIHELKDPVSASGNFQDNASYSILHTQSTRTTEIDDGAAGGLDDRFDLFLCSQDIFNGSGNYTSLPMSYKAIGNDGQHLNLNITDPPAISTYPSNLINALYNFSDHLPVSYTLKTNKNLVDGISDKRADIKWRLDKEHGQLYFQIKDGAISSISLMDYTGRLIKKKTCNYGSEQSLELPSQNHQILLLIIDTNKGQEAFKLLW